MLTVKKKLTAHETKMQELSEEIRIVTEALENSDAGFNEVSDEDLVEAVIYERSALRARYSYLIKELRRLKNEEIKA